MTSSSKNVFRMFGGSLLAFAVGANAAGKAELATLIAPAAPGGGWDQTARSMQQVLQQAKLSNGTKVTNVPGAGGTIGLAQFVNNEKGKGDVAMVMGLIMVGAVLTNKSPVTLDQVTPIARLTGEYEVLVVPAASPHKKLDDVIRAWKADPGAFSIAGGSAGGADHMMAGLVAKAVGIDVTKLNYVPHSGGGESLASMIGNQVAAGINGLNEMIAFIKTGRLRAIAISSEKRVPGVDIPTFKEQGVDVTLANWRGVVAPPGITAEQRSAVTSLMDKMHKSKQWKDVLAKNNWLDMYQSGPAFEKFLKEENARTQEVLKSIGLVK
ncbi:MAG TPA: tripartite tricarboxylate transporter substrate-binding protein [Myxococcaceae bacterium]|nr:tripartite tricarboxylate transporter substrate-binding protein [Myxococcaceae bacterium]